MPEDSDDVHLLIFLRTCLMFLCNLIRRESLFLEPSEKGEEQPHCIFHICRVKWRKREQIIHWWLHKDDEEVEGILWHNLHNDANTFSFAENAKHVDNSVQEL